MRGQIKDQEHLQARKIEGEEHLRVEARKLEGEEHLHVEARKIEGEEPLGDRVSRGRGNVGG
jgi:hypothetical protein